MLRYDAATARKLWTTSGVSPMVARRERRILPVARSMAMTLTSISSPSLQMSWTVCTRLLVELADVHEPVRAREDLDEGAELGEALDDAQVVLAHLGLGREALDDVDGLLDGDAVGRRDEDRAVVLDLDGDARLRRDAADGLAAGADDLADLVRLDVQRVDARREQRHLRARGRERLRHLAEDEEAAVLGLAQAPCRGSRA